MCVCSLSYPACNAHAPYCHHWPVRLHSIFPHYVTNSTIFEKKSYWISNVCFHFLYNVCVKQFSFYEELSEILSYMEIGGHVKYPLFLSFVNETGVFLTTFRKIFIYQIWSNSVQWEPIPFMRADRWTDGRIDRQTDILDEAEFCVDA